MIELTAIRSQIQMLWESAHLNHSDNDEHVLFGDCNKPICMQLFNIWNNVNVVCLKYGNVQALEDNEIYELTHPNDILEDVQPKITPISPWVTGNQANGYAKISILRDAIIAVNEHRNGDISVVTSGNGYYFYAGEAQKIKDQIFYDQH